METDFSASFANRLETAMTESNTPLSDLVTARMQRIEELERARLERAAAQQTSNAGGNAASRLERRDRFIRQTTSNISRSTERRSFAPNVQRTPVHRSQSFENNSSVLPVNQDTLSFREVFESTRQNLFGGRISASSENLSSSYLRRAQEIQLSSSRSNIAQDSDSGSSTPRRRADMSSGLAEMFSSVRTSLLGSDSSITTRDTGRALVSTPEETGSQRFQTTELSSPLTRSASLRDSQRRESRLRRRTIQGVDSHVRQALEQRESVSTETRSTRSASLTRSQLARSIAQSNVTAASSVVSETGKSSTIQESSVTSSASSNSSYNSYSYSGRRNIEICPEETEPALGLEDEKVIFVDDKGHMHWLNKHHQLVRSVKNKIAVPEIVIKDKLDHESDSYVAAIEGDPDNRYNKLRELVILAKFKETDFQKFNETDAATLRSLSLIELSRREDVVKELNKDANEENLEEKFKSYSLYTPPRPKPDLEEYLTTRVVVPLYDGIDTSVFESSETSEKEDQQVQYNFGERAPLHYELSSSRFASSQRTSATYNTSNGTKTSTQESRSGARQENYSFSNDNGSQSMSHRSVQQSSFSQSSSTGGWSRTMDDTNEPEISDSVENNSEVNLVMDRIHMMQGASGQEISTGGLSYEEMLSIQQALADNPSPPESPEPLLSPGNEYFAPVQRAPTISSPIIESPLENPISSLSTEQSAIAPRRMLPQPPHNPEAQRSGTYGSFTRQRRQNEHLAGSRSMISADGSQKLHQAAERAVSQSVVESLNIDEVTPGDTSQMKVSMSRIDHVAEELAASQTASDENQTSHKSIASRREVTNSKETSDNGILSSTTESSSTVTSEQRTSRFPSFTPRLSRISSSGSEASPRLQRLSSSGSDGILALPTMDFSSLERSRPSQRFNFNETSSAIGNSEDKSEPTASTSDQSAAGVPVSQTGFQSQLTIEIPQSSATSPQSTASRRSSGGTPKSSVSPFAKSRNASRSGSEATSPDDSETVTTVFEEFVQTIPRGLLTNWSPSHDQR